MREVNEIATPALKEAGVNCIAISLDAVKLPASLLLPDPQRL